ncbi:hypothetical protein F5Y10DRAFT_254611 [Nemania abortiva]|nr:hypothetical protein F5Y10DRAFT_254611 [Nemania abortiva]
MFNGAQETNFSEIWSPSYCWSSLKWRKANANLQIRNTSLSFSLHPLIRSYRVRSTSGLHSQKRVFDDPETFQITQDGWNIPQVPGIYTLHASRVSELRPVTRLNILPM